MKEENKNIELWNAVCETDPFYCKSVGYGAYKFTAINAQYQLKNATAAFGKYGEGWGIKAIDYEYVNLAEEQVLLMAKCTFFADKAEFPISSGIMLAERDKSGKLKIDSEVYKKIETDITTKALSKLGFNADVFLGRYDDNRYVNDMKKKFEEVPSKFISEGLYNTVLAKVAKADKNDLKATIEWAKGYNDNEYKTKINDLISARKKEL